LDSYEGEGHIVYIKDILFISAISIPVTPQSDLLVGKKKTFGLVNLCSLTGRGCPRVKLQELETKERGMKLFLCGITTLWHVLGKTQNGSHSSLSHKYVKKTWEVSIGWIKSWARINQMVSPNIPQSSKSGPWKWLHYL